jgi:putative ubiquitin-RnfH superfamily antitoxin RatB of RatAB toxin-antitoxin module
MSGPVKRCTVAYATPERQYLWELELPMQASIGAAIEAARVLAPPEVAGIAWEALAVGIFGAPRTRTQACAHGDRIELYRPLRRDPRERRRERVQRERGSPRR